MFLGKKKKISIYKKNNLKVLDKKIILLIFIEIINQCINKGDKDDKKEEEE